MISSLPIRFCLLPVILFVCILPCLCRLPASDRLNLAATWDSDLPCPGPCPDFKIRRENKIKPAPIMKGQSEPGEKESIESLRKRVKLFTFQLRQLDRAYCPGISSSYFVTKKRLRYRLKALSERLKTEERRLAAKKDEELFAAMASGAL